MIINAGSLNDLMRGFKTIFNQAFDGFETHYNDVAMVVPSATRGETYGWLGEWPAIRQWVGDRIINNLEVHKWTIENLDFESTVSVHRNDIADDKYGVYSPFFSEMGRMTAQHPDELIFNLLGSGETTLCYDGQNFFDTDHPVADAAGADQPVSNSGGGAGTPWYLLDTSKMVKPLVFQEREKYQFVSLDKLDDPNVFMRREFLYGVQARVNAGFGLWQLAYMSKQELNAANYETARQAMMSFTGDHGRKLHVQPDTLVVPNSLEGKARRLIINDTRLDDSGGTSIALGNEWRDSAKLIVTPYL